MKVMLSISEQREFDQCVQVATSYTGGDLCWWAEEYRRNRAMSGGGTNQKEALAVAALEIYHTDVEKHAIALLFRIEDVVSPVQKFPLDRLKEAIKIRRKLSAAIAKIEALRLEFEKPEVKQDPADFTLTG